MVKNDSLIIVIFYCANIDTMGFKKYGKVDTLRLMFLVFLTRKLKKHPGYWVVKTWLE